MRFEAAGHVPVEFLEMPFRTDEWMNYPPLDPVKLDVAGELPDGMVRIPGFPREVNGETIEVGEYLMDRHEVTNGRFKEFVDAGGYQDSSYWTQPFVDGDAELTWSEAMARWKDQSGRPGPATWRLGSYPEGQADYPVGGLSWYEAEAYARFMDKELPTTIHWRRAMRFWRDVSWVVAPGSNLGLDGPRPVGDVGSMGPYGIYDQVGNVREWCWNAVAGGRAARGGAWNDPPFMTMHILPKGAWDRDPTHGLRLARTFDPEDVRQALRGPINPTRRRDYREEEPVSDAEYEIFRRLYDYDPVPLDPAVEAADTFEHWVRQSVTFELPYGERGGAYLYLPHEATRPLQTVVYWGGSGVVNTNSPDDEYLEGFDFLMRSGRAVAQPVWQGSFWRDDANFSTGFGTYFSNSDRPSFREVQIQWIQDMATTLDYMETREDLDPESVGYFGFSWGGQAAPIALALETRMKAAVLNVGGLWPVYQFIPEADPLNFAPHVRTPVLMINGEYDNVFPLETGQKPLYELLGTAPEDKEHHVTERAHVVPRDVLYRKTLEWFDRYLGPLRR